VTEHNYVKDKGVHKVSHQIVQAAEYGKVRVIHEIEKHLPLALYRYEWKVLGEGKDKRKYYPFSHIELLIPWVFGVIYVLLGAYLFYIALKA
jgi:hypothetical protein